MQGILNNTQFLSPHGSLQLGNHSIGNGWPAVTKVDNSANGTGMSNATKRKRQIESSE